MIWTFGNKILTVDDKWADMGIPPVDPYNPLNLPDKTIRLRYMDDMTPTFPKGTAVQVTSSPNVWDLTYNDNNWYVLLECNAYLLEVLGANTRGVTNMEGMFSGSTALTSVPLFNTSSVTNMAGMFDGCRSLTSVPLFNTSSVTSMTRMFYGCELVESGALALYQQASTQTVPPNNHRECFTYCGKDTVTGRAELGQIPMSWGGGGPD